MTTEGEDDDVGWPENRKLILWRLQAIDRRLGGVERTVTSIDKRLSAITIRASVLGGLGGLLVTAVAAAIARHYLG